MIKKMIVSLLGVHTREGSCQGGFSLAQDPRQSPYPKETLAGILVELTANQE